MIYIFEIYAAVGVGEKYLVLAVRAVHIAFGLGTSDFPKEA